MRVAARVVLMLRRVDVHGIDGASRLAAMPLSARTVLCLSLCGLCRDVLIGCIGSLRSGVLAGHMSILIVTVHG